MIMWVPGSIAFLVPLFAIGVAAAVRLRVGADRVAVASQTPTMPERLPGHRLPVLRASAAGATLRSACDCRSSGRFCAGDMPGWRLQLPLACLAGGVIVDGLRGPQVGADEPGRRPALDSLARAW